MSKPITKVITLQAITFLHPGTGQSTGVVDLPIQREVHTDFPMYASSGFKGSLRDKAETLWGNKDEKVTLTFGASTEDNQDAPSAGAMAITDARILAFPVRSLQNVFNWVTCPMVIKRLIRDASLIGQVPPQLNDIAINTDHCITTEGANIHSPLVLEEMLYTTQENTDLNAIGDYIASLLHDNSGFDKSRLIMLNDDDFKYHVKYGTQVAARIKLNEHKTTTGNGGNLWYEETIPPETILYAFALCHKPREKSDTLKQAQDIANCLQQICDNNYLQIGGNETVGQGWCSVNITPNDEEVFV